jgi:hypothetical protein
MDTAHLHLAITNAPLFGAIFGMVVLISTTTVAALVGLNVLWSDTPLRTSE